MNIKALITTMLVLGGSSIAMAKPVTISPPSHVVVRDHRSPVVDEDCNDHVGLPTPRPMPAVYPGYTVSPGNTTVGSDSSTYTGGRPYHVVDHRQDAPWLRPARWIALSEPTRIDRGREFFTIGAQAGRFSTLRLFNNSGRSHIQQVAIEFGNGRTQVVRIDRNLTSSAPITIDLEGGRRQINRIVVYGWTAPGSAYQILAK